MREYGGGLSCFKDSATNTLCCSRINTVVATLGPFPVVTGAGAAREIYTAGRRAPTVSQAAYRLGAGVGVNRFT